MIFCDYQVWASTATILFCLKSDRALSNISSPTSDPSQLVVCGTKATLFSRVAIIQPCTASFRFAFVSLFCAILFCDVIMTSHNDVINGSIVQYGWKYHIPLLSTRTKCLMSCSFYFTLSVGCIECANTETRFSWVQHIFGDDDRKLRGNLHCTAGSSVWHAR